VEDHIRRFSRKRRIWSNTGHGCSWANNCRQAYVCFWGNCRHNYFICYFSLPSGSWLCNVM